MKFCIAAMTLAGVVIGICASARADENILYPLRPKWELGLNLGAFYLPDYPGSNQSHLNFLPLPYIVYRGEFLKSDQSGGIRGLFVDGNFFDIDFSADTAFPVDSSANTARMGMQSLDWMFEVGPRALFHLYKKPSMKIDLGFAVRAIYSINLKELWSQGFDFYPSLKYYYRVPTKHPSYFSLVWGGIWATDKLMEYFYNVDAPYVTPSRPAYGARPGFLGQNISATYVTPVSGDWSVYVGFSKNFYSESANRASPLMRAVESESYFIGIYWSSFKSVKEVVVADD